MHTGHQGGGFGPRGPGQFGPQHGQWVISVLCYDVISVVFLLSLYFTFVVHHHMFTFVFCCTI